MPQAKAAGMRASPEIMSAGRAKEGGLGAAITPLFLRDPGGKPAVILCRNSSELLGACCQQGHSVHHVTTRPPQPPSSAPQPWTGSTRDLGTRLRSRALRLELLAMITSDDDFCGQREARPKPSTAWPEAEGNGQPSRGPEECCPHWAQDA